MNIVVCSKSLAKLANFFLKDSSILPLEPGQISVQDQIKVATYCRIYHDTIKTKAEIGQVTGDLNLSFEVLVLNVDGSRDDMIWTGSPIS
ncbi:hypothetical protein BYT27DRAFT_7201427 [Phlegmacium glaucopus]|nr:hypothetical protein BYT27DRAFT_7201427 [Phlegmacium glaucopus]